MRSSIRIALIFVSIYAFIHAAGVFIELLLCDRRILGIF